MHLTTLLTQVQGSSLAKDGSSLRADSDAGRGAEVLDSYTSARRKKGVASGKQGLRSPRVRGQHAVALT
jgi:hypothetical protein